MDDYYDNFYHLMSEAIYDIFWEEFNRSKIIQSPYNYLQNFQIILEHGCPPFQSKKEPGTAGMKHWQSEPP